MSANDFPATRATAMQAAAALARYEHHIRRLVATWLDMDRYAEVSEEIDEIKDLCAILPQVARPWTALLASHAELIHALWQAAQGPTRITPQRQLDEHLECIDVLTRRCLRLAGGGEAGERFA